MSNASNEIDTIAFANGTLYRGVSPSTISQLHSRTYIFQVKEEGLTGTFNVDSLTATLISSDFSSIEANRVIDKSLRAVSTFYAPLIGSPIALNADGTLTEEALQIFITAGKQAMETLERNGEISGKEILINSAQNVLATNEIVTTVKVLPKGNAKYLTVDIGFTTSLTS
jgi:hypothetical protein